MEPESEVGPNSVVPPGRRIPEGEYWEGNPVQYVGKAYGKMDEERAVEIDELGAEYANLTSALNTSISKVSN